MRDREEVTHRGQRHPSLRSTSSVPAAGPLRPDRQGLYLRTGWAITPESAAAAQRGDCVLDGVPGHTAANDRYPHRVLLVV
jgi:hypothetical protein